MNPDIIYHGPRRTVGLQRDCAVCLAEFTISNGKQQTCSDACKVEARRRWYAANRPAKPKLQRPESPRASYFKAYQARRKEIEKNRRRCKVCKCIAKRLSEVGCLECYARIQPRREWSDCERDVVERCAGRDDTAILQHAIYKETNSARTRDSIRHQMKSMGIKFFTHQEGYTIPQLVEITGKSYGAIYKLTQNGTIKNIGRGHCTLVSVDDGDKVIAMYRRREQPSYSVDEATELMGYGTYRSLLREIKKGLPSWKEGHTRRVCKVTIDRAVEYLKTTGSIRVPWRSLMRGMSV